MSHLGPTRRSRAAAPGSLPVVAHALVAYALVAYALVACKDDAPAAPRDGAADDARRDTAGASDAVTDSRSAAPPYCASLLADRVVAIDAHMHCAEGAWKIGGCDGQDCCDRQSWIDSSATTGVVSAMLSLEHFALNARLAGDDAAPIFGMNEAYQATAEGTPSIVFAPSLECWHDAQLDEAGWVERCKAEVDRWVAAGAVGFKDHIGKQFDSAGDDDPLWLGAWNRFNGYCDVPSTDPAPNAACMKQATVRYPALEGKWREVLAYITETKGRAVFTHATTWTGATDDCFDPQASKVDRCAAVTQRHLLSLADWAKSTLSESARRRLVILHFGWLEVAPTLAKQVLDAGLSLDTAAPRLLRGGCAMRGQLAPYRRQIMLGTDARVGGSFSAQVAAWGHWLVGGTADKRSSPWGDVYGLDLDQPQAAGCDQDVPPEMLDDIRRDNFVRAVGCAP